MQVTKPMIERATAELQSLVPGLPLDVAHDMAEAIVRRACRLPPKHFIGPVVIEGQTALDDFLPLNPDGSQQVLEMPA
jgi:hypothetical protein